ncbi:MAG: NFACT family protein [Thermoanaerobacteraceae bacterium]|nr:NFACT family protein [Thermoanaerobacteraceae bacterium]
MAVDGLFLSSVTAELSPWVGSRVDRVYQPDKDTIILHLRRGRETKRLLMSAHAEYCRLHFTDANPPNPPQPPLFCMVLRKHVQGGFLTAIQQVGLERVIEMHFSSTDEVGRSVQRILVVEIMGKHSNIILLEPGGTIIDALRRYTHAVSRYREVLPGRPYVPPPPQGKRDPRSLDPEEFSRIIFQGSWEKSLKSLLVKSLDGIGLQTAVEILHRAGLSPDTTAEVCGEHEIARLWQALQEVLVSVQPSNWQPTVVRNRDRTAVAFAAFNLLQFGDLAREFFPSPSQACEVFYEEKRRENLFIGRRRSLSGLIERELRRCLKKEALQAETVAAAAGAEQWRLYGELIAANMYRLKKGMDSFTAENFYDPGVPELTIELDPSLTPAENAERYFSRYHKVKNAARQAALQLEQTREEMAYLNSVAQALEMAETLEDLEEIAQELVRAGYLPPEEKDKKPSGKTKEKERAGLSRPLQLLSGDGFTILVGKNNRQNDYLSLKLAKGEDIWLHAKDVPGSHVLIRTRGRPVPDRTLEEAAGLAAYFSRARQAKRVAVDYTRAKYVRKPPGARPGMVIYDHHHTVYVAPISPSMLTAASTGSGAEVTGRPTTR